MNRTRSTMLAAALALAVAAPASAQLAPAAPAGPPLLSISVTESVESRPDVATVSTGVEAKAPTAGAAMRENAATIDRLIAALGRAGVAARDMQTSAISLSPQYVYGQKGPDGSDLPPRFAGYQASTTLTVRSRDIAALGPLLDRLVAAGATNINGPSFALDDPALIADAARAKAVARAKARAELYAKAAGYARVRLVALSESGGEGVRPPMPMAAQRMEKADTRIEAGAIETSVTVTAQYALEP